jgi:hypothetical protein
MKKSGKNHIKLKTKKIVHYRPSWAMAQLALPAGATQSSAPVGDK